MLNKCNILSSKCLNFDLTMVHIFKKRLLTREEIKAINKWQYGAGPTKTLLKLLNEQVFFVNEPLFVFRGLCVPRDSEFDMNRRNSDGELEIIRTSLEWWVSLCEFSCKQDEFDTHRTIIIRYKLYPSAKFFRAKYCRDWNCQFEVGVSPHNKFKVTGHLRSPRDNFYTKWLDNHSENLIKRIRNMGGYEFDIDICRKSLIGAEFFDIDVK